MLKSLFSFLTALILSHPVFFLPLYPISVTGALNRGSWLGFRDLATMQEKFHLHKEMI